MATGATRMLLVRRAASSRHHRCCVTSVRGRFRSRSAASHPLAVSGSTTSKSRSKRLHQAPLPATTMMTTHGTTGTTGIEITSQQSPPRALLPSFPLHSMQSGLSGRNVGRSFSSTSSSGELQPRPPPSFSHPDVEATGGPAVILERDTKEGAVLKNNSVPRPSGPSSGTTAPIFEVDATLEEVANESAPAIAQSNAEANYSMLSSTLAVSETPSSPSDVEPSMPMELLEEPSVDPYEQALHVESETPAPLGNSHGEPKTLILQEMMDSAESNLHRMLALADDLYEEDEEAENRGRAHGAQDEESKGRKRHHRQRRAPLRERVERMAERRRDEQSARGIEERELRLERRRRQWGESAAATAKAGVNSSKPNGKGIEGLGRERASSYEYSSFDEEQNFWKSDAGVAEEKHASDNNDATNLSDPLTTKKEEAKSGDVPFADTTGPNSSLADLLGAGRGSSESTDFDDEFSEIMTAPNDDEEQSADTEVPSTAQKPSLMELLGDDFSFSPTNVDHASESPKPVKRHKEEEVYEPPSSLMDLLNENFNIPSEERGTGGTNLDLDAEQRPAGSLMDLLSENFTPQTEEVISSTNLEDGVLNEEASKESRGQSSNLFELLNDCDEGSNEDSLMNLLDDDEKQGTVADRSIFGSDSLGTFGGEDSGPNVDASSRSASLFDLLDGEDDKKECRDALDINTESISYSGISDCETPREDEELLGLLSTDFGTTSEWGSGDFAEEQRTSISETVDELLSLLICATKKEWDEITNAVELSLVEEAEREAGYLVDDEIDNPPAKAITLAEDILGRSNEFGLDTDEVNLSLLNLAFMPPTLQSMELMVKLFKLMEDNRRSGNKESSPNAATYALLMAAFGDRGNDHQAAKFVCERMMEAMDTSGLIVDANAVAVGARCLRKVGDITNAEKLLSDSLGEAGSGVDVSPRVFHHALALYKEDNLQEEGLKLLDVFINETGIDGNERKLDEFVKSLIRWPQRNRRGNRIALALHHQKILEYLETHCIEEEGGPGDPCSPEDTDRQYKPSYFVWRDLLRSLFRAARQESKGQFDLVRRACRCLVNSSRDETHPDHFVLQAGLTAAEALGDAKLASDMILWAWENAEQFVETPSHERGSYSSGQSEEPPPSPFGFETREDANADLDAELDSLFGTASIDIPKDDEVHQSNERPECPKQDNVLKSDTEPSPSELLSILDDPDPETPIENFHFGASWFTKDEGGSNILDTDWFHSEHEGGPPRYFIHIPTKAYYSAIKICLASGEPELAHSVLKAGCIGPPNEVDMRLPESSRSHLFNLVLSAYSQVGDFENAKLLLDEMQSIGPRPTEHTYAALITSLAMADKLTDATNAIDSMLSNQNGDGILPGSSSFGACMLAALKAKAYQQVLDLNSRMLDAGISPNSQSYFGVVLASTRLGDRASALKAAESALESKLPINHQGLNLLLKALLPDNFGDGSIASIRSNLRSMGQENKDLAVAANALSRSLRMVETEERRPNKTKDAEKCQHMWQICLRDLCALVHQKDGF